MKKIVHSIIICCILVLSCKKSDNNVEPDNNGPAFKWQAVIANDGSEPIQRHEAAFVGVGNNFYLLGGRGIRPVSIYDTGTESWSQGSEPPIELHHFQPVVYQDKIYIIGAMTGGWPNETPVNDVYIYDPDLNTWTKGGEIPKDRQRGSTGNILYNGKIYVACGIKNGHIGDHKNWLDSYDLGTGEWEVLADAPRARDHFQAVLTGGKIYAAAGRNTGASNDPFGSTIGEVDVYDIAADSWETLTNKIPTERAGNAAILFGGEIVVAGGESDTQEKAHAKVEALNPATQIWSTLPDMLEGRHGTGLLEHKGELYIASGSGNRGGGPELSTMEKYGN